MPAGRLIDLDETGIGHEIVLGILGIDPQFDGIPSKIHIALRKGDGLSGRDADLFPNQVDAGDHFGYGVLHLDARVDLEEIISVFLIQQEFHRAGIDVVAGLRRLDRSLADPVQKFLGKRGRGNFDELLMASLNGTVAGAQMDDVAVLIGKDLHLEMAGALSRPFPGRSHRSRTPSGPRNGPSSGL